LLHFPFQGLSFQLLIIFVFFLNLLFNAKVDFTYLPSDSSDSEIYFFDQL